MKNVFLILICSIMLGCASTNSVISTPAPIITAGKSFETAVEFPNATTSAEGIPMEYEWIEKHYPNAKKIGQSTLTHNKDIYDLIKIQTANGEEKTVYFKMTNWFGL